MTPQPVAASYAVGRRLCGCVELAARLPGPGLDKPWMVCYTNSGNFRVTDGFVEYHIGARKSNADRLGSLF